VKSLNKVSTKSKFKSRNSKRIPQQRTEEIWASTFKFTKSPSLNRQNLVLNMTRKGLADFMNNCNKRVPKYFKILYF